MSSVINKSTSKDDEGLDLGRLLGEVIDHRKLIVSVTSLFTLCYFRNANLSGRCTYTS